MCHSLEVLTALSSCLYCFGSQRISSNVEVFKIRMHELHIRLCDYDRGVFCCQLDRTKAYQAVMHPKFPAIFRHDKHLAPIFLTRIITLLAYLYSLGDWLRMHIVLLHPLSQLCVMTIDDDGAVVTVGFNLTVPAGDVSGRGCFGRRALHHS